jgi:hypothetical protein
MYDARTTRIVTLLALAGLLVSALRLLPYLIPPQPDPPPPRIALAREMQAYEYALEQGSPVSLNAYRDVENLCQAQAGDDRAARACQIFEDARHHNSDHSEIDAAVSLLKQ